MICKTWNIQWDKYTKTFYEPTRNKIKLLEENIGITLSDINLSDIFFFDFSPQASETKAKNKQMGSNQTSKLLHWEGNHQQNEKATY